MLFNMNVQCCLASSTREEEGDKLLWNAQKWWPTDSTTSKKTWTLNKSTVET